MRTSPAAAKRYIQHLRDVNAVPTDTIRRLRGEIIRWSPSLAGFFDAFPNLKSCLIKEWTPRSSGPVLEECDEAIARHPWVHLIDKTLTWETVPEDPNNPYGPIRRDALGNQVRVREVRTEVASPSFAGDGSHCCG